MSNVFCHQKGNQKWVSFVFFHKQNIDKNKSIYNREHVEFCVFRFINIKKIFQQSANKTVNGIIDNDTSIND